MSTFPASPERSQPVRLAVFGQKRSIPWRRNGVASAGPLKWIILGQYFMLRCVWAALPPAESGASAGAVAPGVEAHDMHVSWLRGGLACPNLSAAIDLHKTGREYFEKKQFEEAHQSFKRAYALCPDPIILWNMARCEQELGHPQEAQKLYRRFVEDTGGNVELAPQREAAIRHLQELSQAPPPGGVRLDGLDKARFWPGVALVSLGAGGLASAAVLFSRLSYENEQFDSTTEESSKRMARDQAQEFSKGAIAALVVGGSCLAAGAVLTGLGVARARGPKKQNLKPTMAMMLAPPGGMIFAQWRF